MIMDFKDNDSVYVEFDNKFSRPVWITWKNLLLFAIYSQGKGNRF